MSSTGQIVGGVVGAVVGYFVGNPVLGAQIGMTIGGLVDPPKVLGPRLDDLTQQTSTYGAFIPRIYGTAPVVGNIFWIQGNALIEREAEAEGKGGPEVTNFDYFATFAVGLCEGPIDSVRRIWVGGQLWYDVSAPATSTPDLGILSKFIASNEKKFTLYTGTETQLADPLIQADRGAANVPAYRGLAYIVFEEMALKDFGNSLAGAQVKVEVVKNATTELPHFISPFNTEGRYVNYSGNGIIQTAIFDSITLGPTVTATVEFRDYAADTGLMIKSFLVSASITPTLYSATSSPDAGGGFVVGQYGVAYVGTNVTNHKHIAFSIDDGGDGTPVPNSVSFATSAGNTESCFYAGGAYWLGNYSNTKVLKIVKSLPSFVAEFTMPKEIVPPCAFTDDLMNGGTYIRYTTPSTGSYLMDISYGDPSTAIFDRYLDGAFVGTRSGFYVWDGLVVCANTPLKVYDIATSLNIQSLVIEPANEYPVYPIGGSVFCVNNNIYALNTISPLTSSLSSIVQSECLKSDLLTAADIDVTELTDQVRGYRVSNLSPLRGGIDQLRKAWPFDAIQSGYKIKFKRRGGTSVATITEGELDAREAGSDPGVRISNVREMDLVLPRQLTATYLDASREYDQNVAEESRE